MTRVRFAPSPTGFLHIGGARTYFCDTFEMDPRARKNLDKDGAREALQGLAERLAGLAEFNEGNVEQCLRSYAAEHDMKPGLIVHAARAALTGQSVGPSAFAVFAALGRERVVERLRTASC